MAEKKKKIVVPVDFSEQSVAALNQSVGLARWLNAEIMLLFVVEALGSLFDENDDVQKKTDIILEKRLDKLISEKEKQENIAISKQVRRGAAHKEIIRFAKENNALLIVMGTSDHQNENERNVGASTLFVLQEADCPVLCINNTKLHENCKTILLPLDLTKETRQKVEWSIDIAHFFNAAIQLLSIIQKEDKETVNYLVNQLQSVQERIEKKGVKCASELIEKIKGDATFGANIVDYAERLEADLVVIMTQHENDSRFRHVGGAAQEIIANSSVPVLTIPPME